MGLGLIGVRVVIRAYNGKGIVRDRVGARTRATAEFVYLVGLGRRNAMHGHGRLGEADCGNGGTRGECRVEVKIGASGRI